MKTFLILAALAAAAVAGDRPPILESTGSDLATFAVQFHPSAIDHSSPEALAASFAQCEQEAARVKSDFGVRTMDALAAVSEHYYTPDVAKQVRKMAEKVQNYPVMTCTVSSVKHLGANSAIGFLQETSPHKSSALRLHMTASGGIWIIESVEDSDGKGGFRRRELTPPVKPPALVIPPAPTPDRSGAKVAVESLHAEMRRLFLLRTKALEAIFIPFFDILKAFYGEAAAEKSRAEQRPAPHQIEVSYTFHADAPGDDGTVRVHAKAMEKAPHGQKGTVQVGEAAFDLKKDASNQWRIVAEYERPKQDGPLRKRTGGFGLFLLH